MTISRDCRQCGGAFGGWSTQKYCSLGCSLKSRIKKTKDGCWLWTGGLDKDGYGFLYFQSRTYRAHRVAYEEKFGLIPEGLLAMHECDNPTCCNPDHLTAGSPSENSADMVDKGRARHGTAHGMAKLQESDVHEIRRLYCGGISQRQLGRNYGVSQTLISAVCRREIWRHLPDAKEI